MTNIFVPWGQLPNPCALLWSGSPENIYSIAQCTTGSVIIWSVCDGSRLFPYSCVSSVLTETLIRILIWRKNSHLSWGFSSTDSLWNVVLRHQRFPFHVKALFCILRCFVLVTAYLSYIIPFVAVKYAVCPWCKISCRSPYLILVLLHYRYRWQFCTHGSLWNM